jgi:hypothetical protein
MTDTRHNRETLFLVQETILEAFRFTNSIGDNIDQIVLEGVTPNNISKKVIKQMRTKLSTPECFAVLQMLYRLMDYASETAIAKEEDRKPILGKSRNDVDYTMKQIWISWVRKIEENTNKVWNYDPSWNPYVKMEEVLMACVNRIETKILEIEQ